MTAAIADVEKIEQLAKLEFTDAQRQTLRQELEQILEYVAQLNELETADVPPTSHVLEITNRFREDQTEKWLSQKEVLANAPLQKAGFFSVPKVVDKK